MEISLIYIFKGWETRTNQFNKDWKVGIHNIHSCQILASERANIRQGETKQN